VPEPSPHDHASPDAERLKAEACRVAVITSRVLDYLKAHADTSIIIAVVRRLVTVDYRLSFFQLLEQAKIKARWPVSRGTQSVRPGANKQRVIMHVITFLTDRVHPFDVIMYVREHRLRFASLFDLASFAQSRPGDITDDPTFGSLMTIDQPPENLAAVEHLSAAVLFVSSGVLTMDLATVSLADDAAEASTPPSLLDVHRFLVVADDAPISASDGRSSAEFPASPPPPREAAA